MRGPGSERGNGSPPPVLLTDAAVVKAAEAAAAAALRAAVCWQSSVHARHRLCLFLFAVKRCTCARRNSKHIYQGEKVMLNPVSRA